MRSGIAIRACIGIGIALLGAILLFAQRSPVDTSSNVVQTVKVNHHLLKVLSDDVLALNTNNLISDAANEDAAQNNKIISNTSSSKFNGNMLHGKNAIPNTDVLKKTENAESIIKTQLLEGMIPPNVHYMWCSKSKRWFEFKHYLSIISVIKTINPDKIVIHYNNLPQTDENLYNLWIEDLKRDYQFLILEQMENELEDYCKTDRNTQVNMILNLLNREGGMYISENTWLLDSQPKKRLLDFEIALEPESVDGYILMKGGHIKNEPDLEGIILDASIRHNHSGCSPIHQLYHSVKTKCYIVKGGKFEKFWPMDIWELKDPFGRLCRKLFYGTEKILKPEPSYDTLVPNIGHMVWIGGGPMDFVFYLSLLSMLYVAKVDVVYIHGDKKPRGIYWDNLQNIGRIRSRIKCIKRTPPLMVYQGVIEPWYRALMSDIIRVDLMIKYGGVYTDTDAIWVKPLTKEERGYDAVACFDWVDWSYPYPDSVNFGVSYGKRNAPFWRIFRESMRVLHNDLHGFTGVMNPYRLLEKDPRLIKIDKRLSVICYYSRCHPIWVDDYHNMTNDHVNSHSIPNWKEDVHAFHWTYPNPPEYSNRTTLMATKSLFADIGKFVLKSAGLL